GAELVPFVIAALDRAPRAVDVRARRLGSAACLRALLAGDVGVGVVRAEAAPRGVTSARLSEDRLWLVCAARHPLAATRAPTREAIAAAPIITYSEASETRARTMASLAPHGAQIRAEVEDGRAAIAYARLGLGVALLSRLPGDPPSGRGVVAR